MNTATIRGKADRETSTSTGGIVGWMNISGPWKISKCFNSGLIYAETSKGGIVGTISEYSSDQGEITYCITESSIDVKISGSENVTRKGNIQHITSGDKNIEAITGDKTTQSYKITGKIAKEDLTSITIDDFDKIYELDEEEGKIVFKEKIGVQTEAKEITAKYGEIGITYEMQKNGTKISTNGYLKAGDQLKIIATLDKYIAKTVVPLTGITKENVPALSLKPSEGSNKAMNAEKLTLNNNDYTTTIEYTYTIAEGDDFSITGITIAFYPLITQSQGYAVEKGGHHFQIDRQGSEADYSQMTTNIPNILIVDTKKPSIYTKTYVKDALETNRYTAGKEVFVEITTDEQIQGNYEEPKIQVSFSESGIGKYNYNGEEETSGYAKLESANINFDGTTTWVYRYQIQEGDEGTISIEYQAGKLTDLAGNVTNISDVYGVKTPTPSSKVTGSEWTDKLSTLKDWKTIYISPTNNKGYFTDQITIGIMLDKILYVDIGKSDGEVNKRFTERQEDEKGPSLYLNGDTTLKGTINFVDTGHTDKTLLQYTFNVSESNLKSLTKINKLVLKNENNDDGPIMFADKVYETYRDADADKYGRIENGEIKTINLDNIGQSFILDPLKVSETFAKEDIYADTTVPTVTITPREVENAITNKNSITYEFKWSEEVIGFTADDITVNNGTKGTLSKATRDTDGNYIYTMQITPSVENGNVGELQVIVEQDACQDLVAQSNVRTENVIRIDKKAPILLNLEAYATSDTTVNPEVDSVKEYYKVGDTVTIVATFDEGIENTKEVPVLNLEFSKSGNAKGTVSAGVIEGNKITYTYTLAEGDEGVLDVKGFTGTVIDAATNETKVSKRALEGDKIIADSVAPQLTGITAIAPEFEYDDLLTASGDTKRYGLTSKTREKNTITFITTYSEDVYYLNEDEIEGIENTNKPVLTFKFGTGTERTATFTKIEGNQIYYTYDIASGDNGNLGNIQINGKVCDHSGNQLTLATSSGLPTLAQYEGEVVEENQVEHITADTTKSTFTITATAVNKNDKGDTITGAGNYYRKGSVITITAKTNEYVYKNNSKNLALFTEATAPTLNISFAEQGTGTGTCTAVAYDNNQTIFTYTYVVKQGDNGALTLKIADSLSYDIALNGNNANTTPNSNIVADTVKPYYEDQPGIEYVGSSYRVTFNEELYYLTENNVVTRFGDTANAPLLKFEDNETQYKASVSGKVLTYTGQYVNAKPYLGASRLCDRAGNLYAYYDLEAPILEKIEVVSPITGKYKAGTEITIVATFSEEITGTAPTLALNFGGVAAKGRVSSGVIEGNTITYTYTITAIDHIGNGDNNLLTIASYTGTGLKDLAGNLWVAEETVPTLGGNKITADTIAPTVTITTDVEQTNQDIVTYTFTWSEEVKDFTIDDVEVTNGSKGNFKKVNATTYTLTVDVTNEGRQIVKVNSGVCTDIAGNENEERATYNKVVIDYTKPIIRAKVNGGTYVIDTDKETSTLKETIVVNEELVSFEYIWTKQDTIPEDGWKTEDIKNVFVNSDINLSDAMEEEGTYYLYIRATDKAGNTTQVKTKAFIVKASQITLTPDTLTETQNDVTVTVAYGDGLTENRKAGISGKTQSADTTKVILGENGTVYAEAEDKAGNKVYAKLEVTNIKKVTQPDEPEQPPVEEDKTAPTITFNYTTLTATVGSPIGATITTDEDAIISYSWDNQTWTTSKGYVRNQNATKTPNTDGTYTLYAKATDKASNQSSVQTLVFTIVKTDEEIEHPEIVFEDLTTVQVNGVKYVKIPTTATTTILTDKMDKDALVGKTPDYTNLTSENELKTGSEIKIDGETKYVIIVNGDVNCDGEVTFLGDIVMANNYRIGLNANLSTIQILAADINNSGEIEFIPDIVAMNNYRLGRIKSL